MKNLPIGITSFEEIIKGNYCYVDKTEAIYELIDNYSCKCLVSRPAGFGKSLLVSTLACIFEGKKELFKGLWIYDKLDWSKFDYTVLHLDFGNVISTAGEEDFNKSLINELKKAAQKYKVDIEEEDKKYPSFYLSSLLWELNRMTGKRIAIVVDNYYSPITNCIDNLKKAEKVKGWIRTTYAHFKSNEHIWRLIGVDSITFNINTSFSGSDILPDVDSSTDRRAKYILGFSQQDIVTYFQPYLDKLTTKLGLNQADLLDKIKQWYGGYYWDEYTPKPQILLHHPHSLLALFEHGEFANYWYPIASPNYFLNVIRQNTLPDRIKRNEMTASEHCFSSNFLDYLNIFSLLFQLGYLTILERKEKSRLYPVDFPNIQTKVSFEKHLLPLFKPSVEMNDDNLFEINHN